MEDDLIQLASQGSNELPYASNAKIKLRKLEDGEWKDTAHQKYCFELEAPIPSAGPESRLYAHRMFDRLPPERHHREIWSILRARKFTRTATGLDDSDIDKLSSIINNRPIGGDYPDLLTPAILALGSAESIDTKTKNLEKARMTFYELYFDHLRRRFSSKGMRKQMVQIGMAVLVESTGSFRGDETHQVCHITGISGAEIQIRTKNGVIKASSSQIVPLGKFFQPNSGETPPGGGACSELGHESDQGGDMQTVEQHAEQNEAE